MVALWTIAIITKGPARSSYVHVLRHAPGRHGTRCRSWVDGVWRRYMICSAPREGYLTGQGYR